MPGPEYAFLHQQDPGLHSSKAEGVDHVVRYLRANGERIADKPAHRLEAYMGFLAEQAIDGVLTGDEESIRRQVNAACVTLTPDNANAYVKFQMGVARQLGQGGDVDPEAMTDKDKMEMLRVVRTDQQRQLTEWVDELNSPEAGYPDWFKYWVFQNVCQLKPNPQADPARPRRMFRQRDDSTFALFPDLDRASLSLVYDAVLEKIGVKEMPAIGNEYQAMRALLSAARFGELYGEAQNHGFVINDKLKAVTTGSWVKYRQTRDRTVSDEMSRLVGAYRTGWCTAGSETARQQLSKGDFYIWCSENPDGTKPSVPRIAVRMEHGSVAEVRGILPGQELEPELTDIVIDKIRDLPGGDSYFQRVADMKRLNAIEKRLNADERAELSDEDVLFLYELGHEIQSFGYNKDPRIAELRAKRGEQSRAELLRVMPEAMRRQLAPASASYETVAGHIATASGRTATKDDLARLFAAKDAEWRANGTYEYLVEQVLKNDTRFVMVITPNVAATADELISINRAYRKALPPISSSFDPEVHRSFDKSPYTAEELSGNHGDGLVRFNLVPLQPNADLEDKTVAEQVTALEQLRTERPQLQLRVPSVLDAVTYWFNLRNAGIRLREEGRDMAKKTTIRHFDLRPVIPEGFPKQVVPFTSIRQGGYPTLEFALSDIQTSNLVPLYTRLAVG